jgi:hypothetical protein
VPEHLAKRIEACVADLLSQSEGKPELSSQQPDDLVHQVTVEQSDGHIRTLEGRPIGDMGQLVRLVHEGLRAQAK